MIDMLQASGWRLTKSENDIRHFKHTGHPLTVTLSGKLDLLVPPGIAKVIRRSTQLEENNDALRGDL
jgi:hypothetical protein